MFLDHEQGNMRLVHANLLWSDILYSVILMLPERSDNLQAVSARLDRRQLRSHIIDVWDMSVWTSSI